MSVLRRVKISFEVDSSKWHSRKNYNKNKKCIQTLKVFKNNADRAIAFAQSFNNHLTKNKDALQYLLPLID